MVNNQKRKRKTTNTSRKKRRTANSNRSLPSSSSDTGTTGSSSTNVGDLETPNEYRSRVPTTQNNNNNNNNNENINNNNNNQTIKRTATKKLLKHIISGEEGEWFQQKATQWSKEMTILMRDCSHFMSWFLTSLVERNEASILPDGFYEVHWKQILCALARNKPLITEVTDKKKLQYIKTTTKMYEKNPSYYKKLDEYVCEYRKLRNWSVKNLNFKLFEEVSKIMNTSNQVNHMRNFRNRLVSFLYICIFTDLQVEDWDLTQLRSSINKLKLTSKQQRCLIQRVVSSVCCGNSRELQSGEEYIREAFKEYEKFMGTKGYKEKLKKEDLQEGTLKHIGKLIEKIRPHINYDVFEYGIGDSIKRNWTQVISLLQLMRKTISNFKQEKEKKIRGKYELLLKQERKKKDLWKTACKQVKQEAPSFFSTEFTIKNFSLVSIFSLHAKMIPINQRAILNEFKKDHPGTEKTWNDILDLSRKNFEHFTGFVHTDGISISLHHQKQKQRRKRKVYQEEPQNQEKIRKSFLPGFIGKSDKTPTNFGIQVDNDVTFIGIDPGRVNLYTAVRQNQGPGENYIKGTYKEYAKLAKFDKFKLQDSFDDSINLCAQYEQLKNSLKTLISSESVWKYSEEFWKDDFIVKLVEHYGSEKRRKRNHKRYLQRIQAMDFMVNKIIFSEDQWYKPTLSQQSKWNNKKKRFQNQSQRRKLRRKCSVPSLKRKIVIGLGSGGFNHASKGHPASANKLFEKRLFNAAANNCSGDIYIYKIDEHKTSQNCCWCFNNLSDSRVHKYRVKTCSASQCTTRHINRDLNASKNLLYLLVRSLYLSNIRPQVFSKKKPNTSNNTSNESTRTQNDTAENVEEMIVDENQ